MMHATQTDQIGEQFVVGHPFVGAVMGVEVIDGSADEAVVIGGEGGKAGDQIVPVGGSAIVGVFGFGHRWAIV